MKNQKPVSNDFLSACLAKNYSSAEIKVAFKSLEARDDEKFLRYFLDCQKSKSSKVRELAWELAIDEIKKDVLWQNFAFLIECEHSENVRIAKLADTLLYQAMQHKDRKYRLDKIDYLIACYRSSDEQKRERVDYLVNDIDYALYYPHLDSLVAWSNDENVNVRAFAREKAIGALGQHFVKNEELGLRFEFIMSCALSDDDKFGRAKELSFSAMYFWPVEKVKPHFAYLLACRDRIHGWPMADSMRPAMRVIAILSADEQKAYLPYLLECWHFNSDVEMTLKLIIKIIAPLPTAQLAEYIDVLIACQNFSKLQSQAKRLALSIKVEELAVWEQKLDAIIEELSNLSGYHFSFLTLQLKMKLLASLNSKDLSNQIRYIFACHNHADSYIQAQAKKLARSIKARDLKGQAAKIAQRAFSSQVNEFNLRHMSLALCFKIKTDELLLDLRKLVDDHCDPDKYNFLKELAFRIKPNKFNPGKMFELNGYFGLNYLLALRAIMYWDAKKLKRYSDKIFTCRFNNNPDIKVLANRLYDRIQRAKFNPERIAAVKNLAVA
ncbi:MAG: hypothetical protein HY931_00805 [Candidatus Falkowbacteria bacterium]|nr:MAG: hypothetical protein HY931_00805 [Candidatus Falkowbacteria bacterium]